MRLVVVRRADAFEELYRRHAAPIAAVASRLTPDRASADDLTQTTFLKLWEQRERVTARGGSLRAWLFAVLRNVAIDRRRRVRPVIELDEAHDRATTVIGPEERAMERQSQRDIQHALAALDNDQRIVIELAYFGGLSQTEIAAVVNAPLGTVKSRVRLAMRHLRDTFTIPEEGLV
ncbi:MAG: sigma-70 family RNA polymerase sigma factor [Candidatus Velthaea sp.]